MGTFGGAQPIVTDGLVFAVDAANYESYPGSGTTWSDLSGNSNNGTLTNGPTFDSGNGGSIVFDGTNDYVRVPSAQSFIPTTNMTIEAWQYMEGRDSTILMVTDGSGANEVLLYNGWASLLNNKFGVAFNSPSGISTWLVSNTTPPLNAWTHICVTKNGTTISLYFNAVFDNSNTQSGDVSVGANSPLLIGVDADSGNEGNLGNYFEGNLSNIKIYNRALTASEITQNYNALKNRFV